MTARAWSQPAGVQYEPGARAGHVESWFLKANDPRGRRALWLKWTLWAGDRRPAAAVAESWAVAFGTARGHVGTKSSVPYEDASFSRTDAVVCIDGASLAPDRASGEVASGWRVIRFDLEIRSPEAPYRLYPARWMYTGPVPAQKLVSTAPSARLRGSVDVDGERWEVDDWPGMVGHNWGRHTERYVWAHCSAWDDGGDDVVVEGAAGRVRAAGVLLPLATGFIVRHHGTTYRLSGLADILRNRSTLTARRWEVHARGPRATLRAAFWAPTEDFVGLLYVNPDGAAIHCLNSKLARAEVTLTLAGRSPRVLRSSRAALEIGTPDPHHGVRMIL